MEMDQSMMLGVGILFLAFLLVIVCIALLQNRKTEDKESKKEAIVGDLKFSAMPADFNDWLICDGRSLDRVRYAELFEVLGTMYGNVDATTFNLPDCRGRVLGSVGQGTNLTLRAMGDYVGEETHTMTIPELVSHNHTGTTDNSGDHTHTHNAPGGQNHLGLTIADGTNTATTADPSQGEINVFTLPRTLNIDHAGTHNHTFTSNYTGSTQPFNIMQPTVFVGNVFIYAGCK